MAANVNASVNVLTAQCSFFYYKQDKLLKSVLNKTSAIQCVEASQRQTCKPF